MWGSEAHARRDGAAARAAGRVRRRPRRRAARALPPAASARGPRGAEPLRRRLAAVGRPAAAAADAGAACGLGAALCVDRATRWRWRPATRSSASKRWGATRCWSATPAPTCTSAACAWPRRGPSSPAAMCSPARARARRARTASSSARPATTKALLGLPVLGARRAQPPRRVCRRARLGRGAVPAPARPALQRARAAAGRRRRVRDDGCKAWCVDWYGNARPIFLGERVFALLGYEIVEGAAARAATAGTNASSSGGASASRRQAAREGRYSPFN